MPDKVTTAAAAHLARVRARLDFARQRITETETRAAHHAERFADANLGAGISMRGALGELHARRLDAEGLELAVKQAERDLAAAEADEPRRDAERAKAAELDAEAKRLEGVAARKRVAAAEAGADLERTRMAAEAAKVSAGRVPRVQAEAVKPSTGRVPRVQAEAA